MPASRRKDEGHRRPRFRFVVHPLRIDKHLWDVDLEADGFCGLTAGRAFSSKRAARAYARSWARLLRIEGKSEIAEAPAESGDAR